MKKFVIFLFSLILFFFSSTISFATSYVLPYPPAMPGSTSYKIHLVWEKLLQYWYYGDFGQFAYNLKQSDTYLVEAKTLFEYNQYLLGYAALQKSNAFFANTLPHLLEAKKHGKDIAESQAMLANAAAKHIEVLQKMKDQTPATIVWNPEKAASSTLQMHQLFEQSVSERQKDL